VGDLDAPSPFSALLVVDLLATGCCGCVSLPAAEPGAITRDQAIAAALREAQSVATDPSVVTAQVYPDPFDVTRRRLVWTVRLQGGFAVASCSPGFLDRYPSPSDPPCTDQDNGIVVVLDEFTGQFLGWSH
jgi:hypothetical protein